MRRCVKTMLFALPATLAFCVLVLCAARPASTKNPQYRSPIDVAFSPDGTLLAVSDFTAGSVSIIGATSGKIRRERELDGNASGLAWSADGGSIFAAESDAGSIAEIRAANGKVIRRLPAGPGVTGLALAPKRSLLLAANSYTNDVSVIDLATGKEKARIAVRHQPVAVAVTPDESLTVVGNLLPLGDASQSSYGAVLSLIDLAKLERLPDVPLPAGSSLVRGVAVSPDGKWAYAVHTVGRFTIPTTQLERGWVNTNALSIIDLAARANYATVLLDYINEGAADPWGIALSKDGRTAWITLSGVHELARIDLAGLHELLDGKLDSRPELARMDRLTTGVQNTWLEIKADPAKRAELVNDLAALHVAGLIERTPLPCNGPRGISISPAAGRMAIAGYFTGNAVLIDPEAGKVSQSIALGKSDQPDSVRRGEMIFHDATRCFQHWLSCATCHPGGRSDGLNWDLLNDGMGNPKNTKSLLLAHQTPPVMSHGVRANADVATVAGFKFILFREPQPGEAEAVQAYVRSMQPEPSPWLVKGKLSDAARRGRKIFENAETGCMHCHPAPLYTDLKLYDVGARGPLDTDSKFDTPTLIEVWRTAPYLHTGEAATLEEVFTEFNKGDRHGVTSHLSQDEIAELVEYLKSL